MQGQTFLINFLQPQQIALDIKLEICTDPI